MGDLRMSESIYFALLSRTLKLKGKRVLEIGGAITPEYPTSANVALWTSIDINKKRFDGRSRLSEKYKLILMNGSELGFKDNSFDVVFSTNCFEHVADLSKMLKEIYRVLAPGGILFTIFGPIWSGPVGHHSYVDYNDNTLTFQDNLFPDWWHLIQCPKQLERFLNDKYPAEVVRQILNCCFYGDDINRLIDRDYEMLISESKFVPILNLRIKAFKLTRWWWKKKIFNKLHRKYPEVRSFYTSGYFWFLCKGPIPRKIVIYYLRAKLIFYAVYLKLRTAIQHAKIA